MRQDGETYSASSFISIVLARVRRDLSAVGKTPKKIRRREFCLYFPVTIPRRREVLPSPAPPGGTPSPPFDLLVWEIPSPARNRGSAPN